MLNCDLRSACLGFLLLSSCTAGTSDATANIGWSLDYANWTAASPVPDPRLCDNVPALSTDVPYDPIETVKVSFSDPAGLVPGLELDYPCERGIDGSTVEITGLVPQTYTFSLQAQTADDVVLYAYTTQDFDLTNSSTEIYPLKAVTGEVGFYAEFENGTVGECPEGVTTFRSSLFGIAGDNVSDTAALVTSQAACQGSSLLQVLVRNIPVVPVKGANNNYRNTEYQWRLEALDADGVTLYCSSEQRTVTPGDDSLSNNMTLTSGDCE